MPSGSSQRPMRMPAAPAISSPARTGSCRSGTPTVPWIDARTASFLRSFMAAELRQMTASRTDRTTRAMNTVLPSVGVGAVRCGSVGRPSVGPELLADLGEDLGAEQLDGLEEGGVGEAADVHLQDLAVVAEQLVEVEDAVGDLVRSAGEHHPAGLVVAPPAGTG